MYNNNTVLRNYRTIRNFKQQKRRELRNILFQMDKFRFCSAFLPGEAYVQWLEIEKKIDEIKELISIKNWGR